MTITTYDPVTGEIKKVMTGQSLEDLLPLIGDDPYIEGAGSSRFYRVDLDTLTIISKE